MESGFVFLDEVLGGVRCDAKYATSDNFTGKPVDGYEVRRVVVSLAMADALRVAARLARDKGFGLLVWDGYRPQRAVNSFAAWSAAPENGLTKARFYPNIDRSEVFARGYLSKLSGHSRGAAVDLTLCRPDSGALVAMGSDFDFMDERSHHEAPDISSVEAGNRRLLRAIMNDSGFEPYEREWWHYKLRDEPFPDRYFDFPIR